MDISHVTGLESVPPGHVDMGRNVDDLEIEPQHRRWLRNYQRDPDSVPWNAMHECWLVGLCDRGYLNGRRVYVARDSPKRPGLARRRERTPKPAPRRRVALVPLEETSPDGYEVLTKATAKQAIAREAKLVRAYVAVLQAKGDRVQALAINPSGGGHLLRCDVFNVTRLQLIEAKASASRKDIRMAIGQLADYGRAKPKARRAVLLPRKPTRDLVNLLKSQEITAIWQEKQGFRDNARGAFT